MKRILKALLVLALVGGSLNCDTNKTHDLPRSYGVNLAMEYTTWNELLQTKDEDRFGAHFQVVPFYQDSSDDHELGKYFGVDNKHAFILSNGYTAAPTGDVNLRYIIHDYNPTTIKNVTLKYEPEQEAYGARIDYYQCLGKILKGLYLKAALPIVHVENNMQLTAYNATGVTTDNMYNYFKGNFTQATTNAQKALDHAKMDGHQDTTDVADIDVVLGYKFLDKEKYHFSINLGFTIPTSNEAHGTWVFEPQGGNGDHWAFGGGLDFGVNLWTKKSQNIKLEGAMNYRYLFEEHENRTLQIKDTPYSQYFLIGKPGDMILTPAANVLTRSLDVEPGSQIDAILQFVYNNGGFNFTLGYNFFWKDAEDVHLKNWGTAEETWAVVAPDHNMTTALDSANAAHWAYTNYATSQLTAARLNVEAAATPSQITNKIYGGLGYIFKEWEYPLMLNLSAHYEFADEHDGGIENWGIWGKLGIAF